MGALLWETLLKTHSSYTGQLLSIALNLELKQAVRRHTHTHTPLTLCPAISLSVIKPFTEWRCFHKDSFGMCRENVLPVCRRRLFGQRWAEIVFVVCWIKELRAEQAVHAHKYFYCLILLAFKPARCMRCSNKTETQIASSSPAVGQSCWISAILYSSEFEQHLWIGHTSCWTSTWITKAPPLASSNWLIHGLCASRQNNSTVVNRWNEGCHLFVNFFYFLMRCVKVNTFFGLLIDDSCYKYLPKVNHKQPVKCAVLSSVHV